MLVNVAMISLADNACLPKLLREHVPYRCAPVRFTVVSCKFSRLAIPNNIAACLTVTQLQPTCDLNGMCVCVCVCVYVCGV